MAGRPLAPDLIGAIALAGIDPTLEPRPLQDALRAVIATRGGYCDWTVDPVGWGIPLSHPEQQAVHGRALEMTLAWCLVPLMMPETRAE